MSNVTHTHTHTEVMVETRGSLEPERTRRQREMDLKPKDWTHFKDFVRIKRKKALDLYLSSECITC